MAFDKGIGGGGYGPIVTSGQIVTGIDAKSAIGIMSLTEGIVSIISVIMYILMGQHRLVFIVSINNRCRTFNASCCPHRR